MAIAPENRSTSLAWYYRNKERKKHDYRKAYHANRDANNERTKAWGKANRAKRAETRRKYYRTPEGNAAIKRALAKYREKYPEKVRARKEAMVLPPQPCGICGKPAQKHHPDYTKPLVVVYLCPPHHTEKHRATIK